MAVAPFEQTCAACHLDHITGKERVSGPKGIAFLTLPGLDLQTLKKKKAPIGEWPEASEADLTPFMKVMISRNERGRVLIEAVKGLNLQDLSAASDDQINAVTYLVWEIKRLFYALITGKASDVLAELNIGGGAKLSANLVADLTASIPRDVVTSAHQQWLPNLGTEMAKRKDTASVAKLSRLAKANQQKLAKSASSAAPAKAAATELEGKADAAGPKPDAGKKAVAEERPQKKAADQTDDLLHPTEEELRGIAAPTRGAGKAAQPEATARKAETAKAGPDNVVSADAARADANAPADTAVDSDAAVAKPQARAAPPIGLKTDVDPETWAEYGGWYRQDYAIFYRPAAHKDKFIYSWLLLAGPQAPKGGTRPAAAVFDFLTSKDAQGACTKCHSVDDVPGKGRLVNFSPPSVGSKQGRFTNFVHEPHFGVLENRGCLTCHQLEKGRPYLQSYEQGNPKTFVSSFGAVKKELCQTCHTSGLARQDCLLCHKYHVNGVIAPIMSTKIPTE